MSSSSESEMEWSGYVDGPDLSAMFTEKETTTEALNNEVRTQIDSDLEYAMFLQQMDAEFPQLPDRAASTYVDPVSLDRISVSSNEDLPIGHALPTIVDLNLSDDSIDEDVLELLDLSPLQQRQLLQLMRTDSVCYSVPGLKLNQISRLQRPSVVNVNSDDNCGVCMAEFLAGEKKRILKCQHFFHVDCIDQWLQKTALCPLCRNRVIPPKRIRLPKCVIL